MVILSQITNTVTMMTDRYLDLYKSTTFFFFIFSVFSIFLLPRILLAESSLILKLSERHTKMLENYCEDRLKN